MLYRKNVGPKERAARFIAGGLMIACGLVGLHASPVGWIVAAAGVASIVTGLVGWCPACAAVGRPPVAK